MEAKPNINNSNQLSLNETHRLLKQLKEHYNEEGTDKFFKKLNAFISKDTFFRATIGYERTATDQKIVLEKFLKKCNELLPLLQSLKQDQNQVLKGNYDRPTKLLIKRSLYNLMQERSPLYFKPNSKNPVDVNDYKSLNSHRSLMPSFEEYMVKGYDVVDQVDSDLQGQDPALISKFLYYPNDLINSLSEFRDAVKHAALIAKVPSGNNKSRDHLSMLITKFADFFVKTYSDCFKEYPLDKFNEHAYNVFIIFIQAGGIVDNIKSKGILERAIKREYKSRKESSNIPTHEA
ncbi:hypothetical protein GALL_276640 [mine drainage metagenome]|uniref:Uncharacterized protein n=1 Tax=mine drainage metagenome TaxID=410659 RepID=A0A1J5R397_9ZZZZ